MSRTHIPVICNLFMWQCDTISGNTFRFKNAGRSVPVCRSTGSRFFIICAEIVFFFGLLNTSLSAESDTMSKLSAWEIIAGYREQRSSTDERSKLTMKLVDSRGRERTRKLEQITVTGEDDNQKMYVTVEEPEDIRGTAFLIIEHKESENDQWLYLPAFRRARRVLPNEKSDSFLGSDFFYEDLETEDLDHHTYRLIREEQLDGQLCWVVEARPSDTKTQNESGYGKRELWINQENFVGLQTYFYDRNEKLIKHFRALDVRKVGNDGKLRAFRLEMHNLKSNHQTIILYDNFDINKGVPEQVFTKAYLERGD